MLHSSFTLGPAFLNLSRSAESHVGCGKGGTYRRPFGFLSKGPSNAVTLIGNQIPVFHIQSVAIVTDYTVIYDT
jgi:hypothetical protein